MKTRLGTDERLLIKAFIYFIPFEGLCRSPTTFSRLLKIENLSFVTDYLRLDV